MIRDSNTLLRLAIDFESGTCSITQILSLSTLLCSTFVQAAQKRHAFINRGIGRRSAARRPGGGWRPHLSLTIFLGRRSAESLGICLADQQRPCVAWARSFILFFFAPPREMEYHILQCVYPQVTKEACKEVTESSSKNFPVSFPRTTFACV